MTEAEEKLIPLLTDEFLQNLVIAVNTCGWNVDYVESSEFVIWCFALAGKKPPELNPIDDD